MGQLGKPTILGNPQMFRFHFCWEKPAPKPHSNELFQGDLRQRATGSGLLPREVRIFLLPLLETNMNST